MFPLYTLCQSWNCFQSKLLNLNWISICNPGVSWSFLKNRFNIKFRAKFKTNTQLAKLMKQIIFFISNDKFNPKTLFTYMKICTYFFLLLDFLEYHLIWVYFEFTNAWWCILNAYISTTTSPTYRMSQINWLNKNSPIVYFWTLCLLWFCFESWLNFSVWRV